MENFRSAKFTKKKILGNGYFILANFWILFIHGVIDPTFIGVLLFGNVAIFFLIKPPPRKVTTVIPALAIRVEISPQPYAFHTVFSHNQKSEMSALLAKNMKQIDQQDGRSMAAQYHHLAYSVL